MNTPTPTGNPWTAETVVEMAARGEGGAPKWTWEAVAQAHNAALAAERERFRMHVSNWEQQLAAERELVVSLQDELATKDFEYRNALAAERKKLKEQRSRHLAYGRIWQEQLDAAVEALRGMLAIYEELHARYDLGDCQATVDARAALAKISGSDE